MRLVAHMTRKVIYQRGRSRRKRVTGGVQETRGSGKVMRWRSWTLFLFFLENGGEVRL